jgi:CheY-like chemotaxis protein
MTTVMIVDDSKLARITVGKILTALKPEWERVEAASAEAALQLVDTMSIDVAILDYNMPGKNGIALATDPAPSLSENADGSGHGEYTGRYSRSGEGD